MNEVYRIFRYMAVLALIAITYIWMQTASSVQAQSGVIVSITQNNNSMVVALDAGTAIVSAGTISVSVGGGSQALSCDSMDGALCNVSGQMVRITFATIQGLTGENELAEISFDSNDVVIANFSVENLIGPDLVEIGHTTVINGENTSMAQEQLVFLPLVRDAINNEDNQRQAAATDLKGDVTCDGARNVIDALAVMQYVVGMRTAVNVCPLESQATTINLSNGDANESGAVDVVDALTIMQCEVGMFNSLCPEGQPPEDDGSIFAISNIGLETNAIERSGQQAEVIITRSGGSNALAVAYSIGETSEQSRTSATADELIVRDGNGNIVNGSIPFAANQMQQRITIQAASDNAIEVPEQFRFVLADGEAYSVDSDASEIAMIARDDEPGITEDSLLFVGMMEPEGSAQTSASGVAIIRLSGDNSYGEIDYNFNNLTTNQTAAHIHYANPNSGPVIFSLPLGQIDSQRWDIEAAFSASTDQAMLDALLEGRLYINAHSVRYPAGEIRGNTLLTDGAPEMAPPQPPESIMQLTGDELRQDIARFLTQATFGPTSESMADMENRVAAHSGDRMAAFEEWIDQQITIESPSLLEYYKAHNDIYVANSNAARNNAMSNSVGVTEGWFTASTYSKAELRERIGFALSQIFVVSLQDTNVRQNPWGISHFYDMLRDGAFGPYRDLLGDVSRHPAMAWYLSHIYNQAYQISTSGELLVSPDQNYAREVMQLFSIGLVELHPDGSLKLDESGSPVRTYTQEDVAALSEAFTGWSFAVANESNGNSPNITENNNFNFRGHEWNAAEYHESWITPLKMFEDNGLPIFDSGYVRFHENREKVVMGNVFPAGQSGEQDMEQALDMLTAHPTMPPFMSYRMIQRLVTSNPSAGYIYRVSTAFSNADNDLGAMVKAILLDPEARNLDQTNLISFGKKKEPVVQAVAAMRSTTARSNGSQNTNRVEDLTALDQQEIDLYQDDARIAYLSYEVFGNGDSSVGQSPLNAPTVFNFFKPQYTVVGEIASAGLVAPEFEQVNSNRLIQNFDFYHNYFVNTQGVLAGRRTFNGAILRMLYDLPNWILEPYMEIMDGDSDGDIDTNDNNFYSPSSIRTATAGMLDEADLYLCGGYLKATSSGNASMDPYRIILDGLIEAYDNNDFTSANNAMANRNGRARMALYLMGAAPQCGIQR